MHIVSVIIPLALPPSLAHSFSRSLLLSLTPSLAHLFCRQSYSTLLTLYRQITFWRIAGVPRSLNIYVYITFAHSPSLSLSHSYSIPPLSLPHELTRLDTVVLHLPDAVATVLADSAVRRLVTHIVGGDLIVRTVLSPRALTEHLTHLVLLVRVALVFTQGLNWKDIMLYSMCATISNMHP